MVNGNGIFDVPKAIEREGERVAYFNEFDANEEFPLYKFHILAFLP